VVRRWGAHLGEGALAHGAQDELQGEEAREDVVDNLEVRALEARVEGVGLEHDEQQLPRDREENADREDERGALRARKGGYIDGVTQGGQQVGGAGGSHRGARLVEEELQPQPPVLRLAPHVDPLQLPRRVLREHATR
jgi:hypothetical protein